MIPKIISRWLHRNDKTKEGKPNLKNIDKIVKAEIKAMKEGKPSPGDMKKSIENEINTKIDEVLELADNNGLVYIQREHVKQLFTMPGAFDKGNEKQLIIFLRNLDFIARQTREEQISAYIRVPVRSVYEGPGVSPSAWGHGTRHM